jgi:iron complex transport system substrate-binding protein
MRRLTLPLIIIVFGVAALLLVMQTIRRPHNTAPAPATATTFPMTVTDARGQRVAISQRPVRIISLAPSVTETLFALGAGDRVIADTTFCDYPPAAAALPKIGGYVDPNTEKIVAMKPDLILGAKGNARDALDRLGELGIPVVTVAPDSLAAVEASIRTIGRAVGESQAAEQLATRCAARRRVVEKRTATLADTAHPRTLLLFSPDSLFSAGPGSHLDEMIRLAGGENIAVAAKTPWPELSMETVVTADPECIIVLTGRGMAHPLTPASALTRFRAERRWRDVTAVKTGHIVVLDDDTLTLPGPRLIDGMEAMAAAIHPELYPQESR